METVFFNTAVDFRKWLETNHLAEKELWVGYYKIGTKKASITYSESVDQAICFGWIDGIRKSIDIQSYRIRFTPRRPASIWSAVNIKKAGSLISQGLMQPAGFACFDKRKEDKSQVYSYENKPEQLTSELEQKFIANEKAWAFFIKQSPSYQRTAYYWIMSAKQQITRESRLDKLIKASGDGQKL